VNENEIGFLLEKVRQGNAEAFAVLCEHFYPQVLKYMYYRVDAVSAEDLSGEVFLRVLCHISEQNGSFTAWLYKIASNVVTDYARKGKVRREGSTDEQLMDLMVDSRNPAEVVSRQMDIHDAMARLTNDQRELIILKFIQGLSNADIAQITGRSEGAIRGLQFRALSALRLIFNGEEQTHEH
jgi:RNA polymerase sigma-70 factor (ECF subfamily)